jgi:hypothetical protein
MNDQLLAQAMELLAEAEISYSANGHFYELEIIENLRSISDQIHQLNDRLKQSYAMIETRTILGETTFEIGNKELHDSHNLGTVKGLFESLDLADFICPGGPLTNCRAYHELKNIFSNPSITIEEAKKRIDKPAA